MSSVEQVQNAATRKMRKATIRVRCEDLIRRPPQTWQQWDAEQSREFRDNVRKLRSMGEATPLKAMIAVAERIGNAYGIGMAALDPNHGEAS